MALDATTTDSVAAPQDPGPDAGTRERADYVVNLLRSQRTPQDAPDTGSDTVAGEAEPETPTDDATPDGSEAEGQGEAETAAETDTQPDKTKASPDKGADDQSKANPESFTVRVNGEELKVTRDELVKGYSREVDYRQKTARLGEERRALDTERQALAKQTEEIGRTVESAIQQAIELASEDALIVARGSKVDWAARSRQDPVAAQEEYFRYSQSRDRLVKFNEERTRKTEAEKTAAEKRVADEAQSRLSREAQLVVEKIPEMADPAKGKKMLGDMQAYLTSLGFTPEEQVLEDHRVILALRDALRYHEVVAAQKAAEAKKVTEAPRVISPKRTVSTQGEDDANLKALKKRAQETGKLRDNAEYVLAKLRSGR